MGKQIVFYAVEEDHDLLLGHAQEAGLLALPELLPAGARPEPLHVREFNPEPGQSFFYLLPSEVAPVEVWYREVPGRPSVSKLDDSVSPVIEFAPSPRRDDAVHDGRLYLGMEKGEHLFDVVSKKFDRLARPIRGWARTTQFNFHVGPRTAELARAGDIRLMHHQIELKVAG
ncbi:MAG: hypothetical protein ABW250_23350 [Pyrinomonadaceae bacterium]